MPKAISDANGSKNYFNPVIKAGLISAHDQQWSHQDINLCVSLTSCRKTTDCKQILNQRTHSKLEIPLHKLI